MQLVVRCGIRIGRRLLSRRERRLLGRVHGGIEFWVGGACEFQALSAGGTHLGVRL